MSKLVQQGLAFGTPKIYIAPYDKINHRLVNLSCNCDMKSGLNLSFSGAKNWNCNNYITLHHLDNL